jgi:lipoyl(octanoyl) transferase
MSARTAAIARGHAGELVWLLEHPPLYTAGTSARPVDLLDAGRFPVYATGRGGQFTYHGPGQRVVYVMLDVKRRGGDVRRFVHDLEAWVIAALSQIGIHAVVHPDRVGVWVERRGGGVTASGEPLEDKIAAIGIRVSRGVSSHGVAINIAPNLDHFSSIVPCGITGHGVTSLERLGALDQAAAADRMRAFDHHLRAAFERTFGPTRNAV